MTYETIPPNWMLKASAKTYKKEAKVSHTASLNYIAKRHGYENWTVLQRHLNKVHSEFKVKWDEVRPHSNFVDALKLANRIWIFSQSDSQIFLVTKEWLEGVLAMPGIPRYLGRAIDESFYYGLFNWDNALVLDFWTQYSDVIDMTISPYVAFLKEQEKDAKTEEDFDLLDYRQTELLNKFSHFTDIIIQPLALETKPFFPSRDFEWVTDFS